MGIKLCKAHTGMCQGVEIRGVDLATEGAHICKAHVIGKNDDDIGSLVSQRQTDPGTDHDCESPGKVFGLLAHRYITPLDLHQGLYPETRV